MDHPESALSLEQAQTALGKWFAPWVRVLGLTVEAVSRGHVRIRMPENADLNRTGGVLSGQAMMAVADTAMALAVRTCIAPDRDIATAQQSTSFFRSVSGADLICEVSVAKQGRAMMFGDCLMYVDGQRDKPAAQATLVYAVIPPRR